MDPDAAVSVQTIAQVRDLPAMRLDELKGQRDLGRTEPALPSQRDPVLRTGAIDVPDDPLRMVSRFGRNSHEIADR